MAMKPGWGGAETATRRGSKASAKSASVKAPKASAMAIGPSPPGTERESISIRPIENGYIVEKSYCTKKGGYESKQYFSAKKPKIEV